MPIVRYEVGDVVRIKNSRRSPRANDKGVVVQFDPDDRYGAYVVRFNDSLDFRYNSSELELIEE